MLAGGGEPMPHKATPGLCSRRRVVIVGAIHHQPQVAPLFRDGQVHHPAESGLDLLQIGVQPFERDMSRDPAGNRMDGTRGGRNRS